MKLRLCLLAAALACAAAHAAPPMTPDDRKAQEMRIEDQFTQAKARCNRVEGHARELCRDRARGERDIESAQLQFEIAPTADNDQKVRLAKAEAAYTRAMIECKEMDGQARAVCRQDAKSTYADAQADAQLQREVVAQQLASENTVREGTAEAERVARAQFEAARKRCEALPPEGRVNCMAAIRTRFGQD